MFHVEQKPSEEIPRDGSLEKLEFFERAGPFGLWFHFPGQGSRILRARRPGHATHMKQARATRLFHVEQFSGRPASLIPARRKGDPLGIRPRDWHSVARCFTWNKSRMRKSQKSGSGPAALLAFYNAVLRTVMRFPKNGSL